MIVLLPPSETKAAGGTAEPLSTASLGFPGLAVARSRALAALDRLVAAGQDVSTPAKARAAADNAAVRTSPTMPAIERSKSPIANTIVSPKARTPSGATWAKIARMFAQVKKTSGFSAEKITTLARRANRTPYFETSSRRRPLPPSRRPESFGRAGFNVGFGFASASGI